MTPKKSKQIVDENINQLNSNCELVKDLLDFYWLHVRKALEDKKDAEINVSGLGSFKIRRKKLLQKILFIQDKIKFYESKGDSFEKYSRYNKLKKELEILREILSKNDTLYRKDQEKLKQRYGKQYYKYLEKSGEDSGGDQERDVQEGTY